MPTIVRESAARPTRVPPTDTGTAHYPGRLRRGPTTPTLVTDELSLARIFGPRWPGVSPDPDYLVAFFRLGGSRLFVQRRVGPAAAYAKVTLKKGSADSANITAADIGVTGNDVRVQVAPDTTAGTAVLTFTRITAGDLASETTPPLASQQELVDWSMGSVLVDVDLPTGATDLQWPPTAVAANATAGILVGGGDDLANVGPATLAADLALNGRKTGPGQIVLPGHSLPAEHQAILAYLATDANKRGVLDAPLGTVANAITAAQPLRALAGATRAAMYRGRLVVRGPVQGSYLTLPWSIVQAAMLSRNDSQLGNPNEAAAGEYGSPLGLPGRPDIGDYVLGLLDGASDDEVAQMDGTGVNPVVDLYGDGTIQVDGDETLADPLLAPLLTQFANSRTMMLVKARGYAIAASYRHRQVDAEGRLTGKYAGDLVGMLGTLQRPPVQAVFGTDADPGYVVDVGPNVNTTATIAAKQLRARIGLRLSPGAKYVYLDIVQYAVGEGVR